MQKQTKYLYHKTEVENGWVLSSIIEMKRIKDVTGYSMQNKKACNDAI